MADTKISALPASTTPLAGTEVLPIVQSGATKQVSVANLTAGRAISATQLTLTTGNLIVAAGQGIDFSADPSAPGAQSELLNDYESGTWTPVDGSAAALTFTSASGVYTKVGRLVTASCTLTYPTTAGANAAYIGGLPFSQANPTRDGGYITNNTSAIPLLIRGYSAAVVQPVTQAGAAVTNSTLSTATIRFTISYTV